MENDSMSYGYTPIWNYTASGVNWLHKQETWKGDDSKNKHPFCLPEGIKLIMIISMASVIEGSLKSYLRAKIQETLKRQKELEGILENKAEDSFQESTDDQRIEIDDIPFPFTYNEDLRSEYHDKVTLLRKVASLNDNKITKAIKSISNQVGNVTRRLFSKMQLKDEKFSKDEQLTLEAVLEIVEKSTWGDLKGYFDKINETTLSETLRAYNPGLLDDINKLFEFRNFIVHANMLEQRFDENNVDFHGNSERLIQYLKDKGFYPDNLTGKYFVEILLPDSLVEHFKKCFDAFFKSPIFNDSFETRNLINTIWRS